MANFYTPTKHHVISRQDMITTCGLLTENDADYNKRGTRNATLIETNRSYVSCGRCQSILSQKYAAERKPIEKAQTLQQDSMDDLIEALANMNQVFNNLNDASLNASASNIISDRELEHRLEGSIRQLMVDASELRSEIGEVLNTHNKNAS